MKKCPIHECELTCKRCDASARGKKGGSAKSDKKKASSAANLKKAYDPQKENEPFGPDWVAGKVEESERGKR